ncbi:MAG: Cof-type HAD-IIB family hydrolase [Anaerococcus sp.]|nr:Cof-type HAD-IIB family hydrolase [Anaerococcus sp.]
MKLIGLDVDGTLVNSQRVISEKTRLSLIRAMEEGHKLAIVTGRPRAGVIDLAEKLEFKKYGGYLSTFNGGMLVDYKNDKVIKNHSLDSKLAMEIIHFSKDLDLEIIIPHKDKLYTRKRGFYAEFEAKALNMDLVVEENLENIIDFAPNKFLFAQKSEKIDLPSQKLKEAFGEQTEQVKSSRFYYEVMPKGLSKGKSLIELGEILGIKREDTLAFGDEMNDYSMIEMAGVGIAMANAVDPIKNLADYITLSNDEDGISYYLEKFILV